MNIVCSKSNLEDVSMMLAIKELIVWFSHTLAVSYCDYFSLVLMEVFYSPDKKKACSHKTLRQSDEFV